MFTQITLYDKVKRILTHSLLFCLAVIALGVSGTETEASLQKFTDETAFATAVGSGLKVINFDTDPAGNPIPAGVYLHVSEPYLPWGADFNSFGGGTPRTMMAAGGCPPISAPNVLTTVLIFGGGGGGFEVVFSSPVNAVGVFLCDVQFIGNTFTIRDAAGNPLGTFDIVTEVGPHPFSFVFFGVISDVPIAKFQFDIPNNDFVVFDNIEFGFVAPPPVNQPPIANAGADQTVECTSPIGTQVTLDGTASNDPDGDPLTFTWSADGIAFDNPNSPTPTATFPLGTTTVTLTVDDGKGGSAQDTVNITVQDTTPPVISSVIATPNLLWPPNHRLVTVTVSVTATDICSPTVTNQIVSVTSNEPDDGLGDGDMPNDIQNINGLTVDLRAERSGRGAGRIYTITVSSTDASGNAATATVTVTVPKSQGKGAPALSPAKTAIGRNFPNPFNPETWIPYTLAKEADVTLRIYDLRGRLVRALALGRQAAGFYISRDRAAYWDGRNAAGEKVASGIYFYQLQAGNFSAMRRMVVVK